MPLIGFSQVNLTGTVLDKTSNKPIPFVNITIPGTYYGTITNNDGVFSIRIPSSYSSKLLVLSCVGFQSDTIPITRVYPEITLHLQEKINELSEVVVMPEDVLRSLLRRAYEKIPKNYAADPVYYEGFYRETLKDDNDQYISFGEALIELVRGDVSLSQDQGQIRLIKSRGGYLSGRDSTTNIHFYGGVFLTTSDFVQERSDFIKPSGFNTYWYTVSKLDNYYKINFKSKKLKKGTEGYFLLDTLSLAYTEARYYKERDKDELIYKRLDEEVYYKFIKLDDRYYLKYKSMNLAGFDKLKKKKMLHGSEYLSTKILPGYDQKIPEKDQLRYFDVFINEVGEYSTDYWNDFNIVETDSLLKKNQLTYKELNSIQEQRKKMERKKKLLKIFSNISFQYGISSTFSHAEPGSYSFMLPAIDQSFNTSIVNHNILGYHGTVAYFFGTNIAITYSEQGSFSGTNKFEDMTLGVEWKKRLNSFGCPNFLSLKASIGQGSTSQKIGDFHSNQSLKWGNKAFDEGNFNVFVGRQALIIKPAIVFSRHLKGKSSLYCAFSYLHELSYKEKIIIEEKTGLFRKSSSEAINGSASIEIYKNETLVSKTGLQTPTFSLTVGLNFLR